ncbi:MAG: hypothetical protein R6X05_01375, partial [Desulfobacterales bacterium]
MSHGLVDLQRHLLAAEDQRGGLLGALRRAEQRPRLLRDAGRVPHEIELAHELPAAGAELAPHPRVAPPLGLTVADGGGVDHRPALDEVLVDAAALA